MEDKRTDAQKMELSAQAEGSSDALQLDPSDLSADFAVSKDPQAGKKSKKSKIKHQPKATQAGLENNIFNALVAPPSPRTTAPEDRVALETQSALENNDDAADALMLNIELEKNVTESEESPVIETTVLDQVEEESQSVIESPIVEEEKIESATSDSVIAEVIPEVAAAQEMIDDSQPVEAEQIIDRIASEVFGDTAIEEDPAPLILKLPLPENQSAEDSDYYDWEPLPPELEMKIVPQETSTDHELVIEEPIEPAMEEIVVEESSVSDAIVNETASEPPPVKMVYDPAAVIPDEAEVVESLSETASFPESLIVHQDELQQADDVVTADETVVAELESIDQPTEQNVILSEVKNLDDSQQDPSLALRMTDATAASEAHETNDEVEATVEPASNEEVVVELKPAAEAQDTEVVTSSRTGAWWSIPLLCLGIAIAACAILVPMADENRRVSHELAQIDQDVAYFQKQSDVNKEFLDRVSSDPTLAERLALRQLRLTRADSRLANIPQKPASFGMSPYQLVAVEPPVKMPEYQPIGGFLSKYFLNTKGQIYLAGLGILLAAAGVILGGGNDAQSAAIAKSEEDLSDDLSTAPST